MKVAEKKTEAIIFHSRIKPSYLSNILVGNTRIKVGRSMKYLEIYIDSTWSFSDHFEYVETKVATVTRALGRLMPNLRGPGEDKRQLFSKVVLSVLFYGAPVWSDALGSSKKAQQSLRRVQRTLAIRVISAYRTVSCDAASLLAEIPPFYMTASCRKRVYERTTELKTRGEWTRESAAKIRSAEYLILFRQWEAYLQGPKPKWGLRKLEAIGPHLAEWLARRHGGMGYHLSQMLTGHGSFGHFLHRIGKRDSESCLHCGAESDTLEHTIQTCPAWMESRTQLRRSLKTNEEQTLTLVYLVGAILESEERWLTFLRFAREVIIGKEEEERRRERMRTPSSQESQEEFV